MQSTMPAKPVIFLSGEIKTPPFGASARQDAGNALRRLQEGDSLSLPLSRPMPSIGRRCHELRIADATQAVTWRIVYRIDADAILVAAVFAKKTEQTPKREIDNCKARLAKYDADTRGL